MSRIVVPCPSCLTLNGLPAARIDDVPVCSSCRARLLGAVVALDGASFERVVTRTTLPVVVDFWAGWCGPCRMMAPEFAAAARELLGRAVFAKVDTEGAPDLAARFQVQSIPLLVLLRDGREQCRQAGAMQRAQIVQWVLQS